MMGNRQPTASPSVNRAFGLSTQNREQEGSVVPAASIATGGAMAYQATPMVTGRTKLYHGTSAKNLPGILEHGIQPGKRSGMAEILPQEMGARNLAYATPSKMTARLYGRQSAAIDEAIKWDPTKTVAKMNQSGELRERIGRRSGIGNERIVELSVPLWKKEYADKVVPNPELRGARSAREFGDIIEKQHPLYRVTRNPISDRAIYNGIKDPAYKGGLGPEVVKGSKSYRRLSPHEVFEYAKTRPGRFLSGVGLGAAGIGLAGYGAKRLYDRMRKMPKNEKRAFWQGFEKRAFDAEYGHPDDQLAADRAVKRNAKNRRNLGGALGLLGGTAGSLLREKSLKSGLIGAGAGTVIGGVAGHLAAKLEDKKIRERLKNESPYGTVANRSIWRGQEAHSPLQRALKDPDAEVSFFDEKGNQYDSTRHSREKMHGRLEEMKKSNPGRFGYMVGLPKSKYQVDDIRKRIESYGE